MSWHEYVKIAESEERNRQARERMREKDPDWKEPESKRDDDTYNPDQDRSSGAR